MLIDQTQAKCYLHTLTGGFFYYYVFPLQRELHSRSVKKTCILAANISPRFKYTPLNYVFAHRLYLFKTTNKYTRRICRYTSYCTHIIKIFSACLFVCAVVYCDYAASGKSLQFIEDYILREVLPVYGNTHTTTNVTSLQSTLYR